MSEASYFWPSEDQPGEYIVERSTDAAEWRWDGKGWLYLMPGFNTVRSTEELVKIGYLGVRREQAKPEPKPDEEVGDAMIAQEALNELRMCRKSYQFERWSIKWGKPLTEMLGAR
jgi:hypothetical protein